MHSKRVGAINLYKATANFAVYNLQNEAKENSPHSASLDVTVRTDTERCKFEDKRSKKMGEYLKEQYEKVDNEKLFEELFESIRKDVKRCFNGKDVTEDFLFRFGLRNLSMILYLLKKEEDK